MQVILYIQVKPSEAISFGNPFADWVREELPEIVLLDADNHSDDLVVDEELKILTKAQSSVLLIDASPEANPGKAARLLESVFRKRVNCRLIHLAGENALLEKMLKLSRVEYQQNLESGLLKKAISKAFLAT